ncbi:GtrA family protein [Duganella sp. LX20W]|uniref:GtrA family protein n=1 Tax=Rugamonas brunnea TaxID=2758569 RepID=A0A7W2ID87_9BURK|nr:GtrA family protein [Rugamonas brunnea]MBA5639015.1 GtrA family protein [Rugamonas brunnea]
MSAWSRAAPALRALWTGLWRRRWFRFGLAGALNTAFGYGAYALLLALGLHYALANLGALALAVCFSFRTHATLVFGHGAGRAHGPRSGPLFGPLFIRYVLGWLVLYAVNVAAIAVLLRAGLGAYAAGALWLAPQAVLSYLMQRHVVFRRTVNAMETR